MSINKTPKPKRRIRASLLVALVLIASAIFFAYKMPLTKKKTELRDLGYSEDTIEIILEKDMYQMLMDGQYYSPTLEKAIRLDTLYPEYIDLYYEVGEKDITEVDLLLYSRLLDLSYDRQQINSFFKELYFWEITPLLTFDYQWDQDAYIEDCKSNRDKNSIQSFELTRNYHKLYRITYPTENPNDISALINKRYYLPSDYEPDNLVMLSERYAIPNEYVREDIVEDLQNMIEQAILDGSSFFVSNTYWSYESLESLYNNAIAGQNPAVVDYKVNKPGHSEHQSGLGMNITPTYESDDTFEDTSVYQWLNEHAYEYGFILRYPPKKAEITVSYDEPSHIRYLGKDLAKRVKDSCLTYDEYYLLYLKGWNDSTNKPMDAILEKVEDYH